MIKTALIELALIKWQVKHMIAPQALNMYRSPIIKRSLYWIYFLYNKSQEEKGQRTLSPYFESKCECFQKNDQS